MTRGVTFLAAAVFVRPPPHAACLPPRVVVLAAVR